ncbi:MAG TPA: PIN domain-containing protein [Ramlibacter sp.]|uniref:PIN domain-containing protein n=1 Tax=Ramlibacter sp. TaxID=1917967 RepID=UPI002B6F4343|nr:PIN domain-containing protein [Ramlibacter sp.]HVZ43403.1 PIN domain-containing protein [Ramlibacter sp.]
MLDTNTASAALRGTAGIDERLLRLDPARWCISAITRAELRYGVALRPEATKLAQYVEAFLRATTTAAWDQAAADAHGLLRAKLRRAGTPIGDFDEMIAAHALALDAVLVSDNTRHFKFVEGLVLENWIRNN